MTGVLVRGDVGTDTTEGRPREDRQRRQPAIYKTQRLASEETNLTDTLMLYFQPPVLQEKKVLVV